MTKKAATKKSLTAKKHWRGSHDHEACVVAAMSAASSLCDKRRVRLTALRPRGLELIWASHKPIGANAILDILKSEHGSAQPPTVYRALDFLREQGLVHRIESLNAFIGCAEPDHSHSGMFLICDRCGDAVEMAGAGIDTAMRNSAKSRGFQIQSRTIEASGLCPGCQ